MITTLAEARAAVELPTLVEGREDEEDFLVRLVDDYEDEVVLVNKKSGLPRREVYFSVMSKLEQMSTVVALKRESER